MNQVKTNSLKIQITPPPKRNHQRTLDNLARLLEQQKMKVLT